jgi:hypothetical protein
MRPQKNRLLTDYYGTYIKHVKIAHGLSYREIASWMNLTASNLRGMLSQGLNPTQLEWESFQKGLHSHLNKKTVLFNIPISKVETCRRKGCNEQFIKWSWNKKDCETHKGKKL